MCGWITVLPTALGTDSRTMPAGAWLNWPLTSSTARAAPTMSLQRRKTSSPASDSRSLRVLRLSKRVPRAFSRRATLRLVEDGVRPS